MLRSSVLLIFGLILTGVSSEYVWTGKEWKWNEPGANAQEDSFGVVASNGGGASSSSVDNMKEGSGDGGSETYHYDDEDEEDYTYDEEDYDKQDIVGGNRYNTNGYFDNNNNNAAEKTNTGILPATDDEDMFDEGSGDDSFGSNIGSGNNNNNNNRWSNPSTVGSDNGYQTPARQPEVIRPADPEPPRQDPMDDYDEDDYDDYYDEEDDYFDEDENDNIGGGGGDFIFNTDEDSVRNVDVQVTSKPTYSNPFDPVTDRPTTHRPKHSSVKPSFTDNEVHREKQPPNKASFFAQPGILAAVIGGAVVGLLCAILLVMFIVYRMRKKDEGSYALDEPKRSHNVNSYSKQPSREFYA